ncbi:hypothetical protein PIB30_080426 [Stylosanthes scabra]|uniref:PB1-like domain-containing protein n=1 Tax=Stylosanthes scabra TaxID=79078 RepID=A0ABU6ZQ21_9FABA|nr:hypothetical protein [Stylosanthes scabra]
MGDTFVVPIFHHGGSFVRNPLGELEYVNELVERFEEMDLDHVNFGNMVKLFEGLRYTKYKAVYWLDKNAPELETGLNEPEGDAGIRDMLDYLRTNLEFEFHLYWEHVINEPVMAGEALEGENSGVNAGRDGGASGQPINLDETTSSSEDRYESVEDEAYKPPPLARMTVIVRVSWRLRKGNSLNLRNVSHQGRLCNLGWARVVKRGRLQRMDGVGPSGVDGPGEVHGPSNKHAGAQPDFQIHSDSGLDYVKRRKGKAKVYEPQFVQSDEDYAYEYHSETLHTPVSSEEEYKKYEWPEFDDDYEFGEEHFELGTKFAD